MVADDSEATNRIVTEIRKRYPSSQLVSGATATNSKVPSRIDIAVGPAALRALVENGTDGVIISVFTSSQVYRSLLEKSPKLRANKVTAVFAEPDPADQLQLISMVYKRRVSVGVVVSEITSYLEPGLQKAAAAANVDLRVERLHRDDSPTRALNRIADATVILAIPDSNVYSTESVRSILDTTYRRNQAVVGFSAPMVRAGVLASVYSDVDDIVTHLVEIIREFDSTGLLPKPQYPRYFQVKINDSVARSLNAVVDEPARVFSRKPDTR